MKTPPLPVRPRPALRFPAFLLRSTLLLAGLLLALLLPACGGGGGSGGTTTGTPRSIVILNARIFTAVSNTDFAEALVIDNGMITHVGTNATAQAQAPSGAVTWDLQGRLLLPGFHDLHVHVLEAGINDSFCPLTPIATPATYESEIAACAPTQTLDQWVRAGGMSQTILGGSETPLTILDRAVPNRPCIVLDDVGHVAYANTLGLQAAGIGPTTPDPQGGVYDRDPNTGELTGVLLENAQQVLRDAANVSDEIIYQSLLFGLSELARNGVTTVSDAGGYWTRNHPAAWQRALNENRLTVRAHNALYVYPDRDPVAQVAELQARFANDPSSRLKFSSAKLYLDGILSLGTAAMVAPYDAPPNPDFPSGFPYFGAGVFEEYVGALHQSGFRLHFHSVGDAAARRILDALESLAVSDSSVMTRGHRATHNYQIHPSDVSRYQPLGLIVDFQIGVESGSEAFVEALRPNLGNRVDRMLPVADMLAAGAHVVLSSDWDADALSPFGIMQRSVTRARQAVPDLPTAVRLLTIEGARALGQDQLVGTIEAGKQADLVIANQDIFTLPLAQVGSTQVLLTMLDGQIVYQAPGFNP